MSNPRKGTYYKLLTGGRRWRPGTQALWQIQVLMRTTNLCIPKLPFLWYVLYWNVEDVEQSKLLYCNFMKGKCWTCQTGISVVLCYRLVMEITYREYQRRCRNRGDAPDLTEEQIAAGERNVCPMRCTKGAVEALHEGMEDANLLAIHAHRITVQPRDIQLARRIRREVNWDVRDYSLWVGE